MAERITPYMSARPIRELFPELSASVDATRLARCQAIVDRFFERTLLTASDGLPFVITGDIPAMWLRDSTWQVNPFFHSRHPEVGRLLADVSRAQVRYVLIDPYANAFNSSANGNCWHKDFPHQSDWVFERKFELDSLASVLYLARRVVEVFGITEHLDAKFHTAVDGIIRLALREQHHDPASYVFARSNGVAHDSLSHGGHGAPVAPTGMVWSGFRPSDDACMYGYHVPSNLFFANELRKLPAVLAAVAAPTSTAPPAATTPATSLTAELCSLANKLADDIISGVKAHALSDRGYAYEVDGLGNALHGDDANVPSLLSLPYLGVCAPDDSAYLATRQRVLSSENPWHFSGTALRGIGSQHTPVRHVWPIAIAVEAMTSINHIDKLAAIELLERTDAGTGCMHESVHVDDPSRFTREWFSWADMTWLDLVLRATR
ncbi:MAG: glycoside hydrolase family 125 protein [Ilumatobacteraceae bacterium]